VAFIVVHSRGGAKSHSKGVKMGSANYANEHCAVVNNKNTELKQFSHSIIEMN
jgi:hypothetical protein